MAKKKVTKKMPIGGQVSAPQPIPVPITYQQPIVNTLSHQEMHAKMLRDAYGGDMYQVPDQHFFSNNPVGPHQTRGDILQSYSSEEDMKTMPKKAVGGLINASKKTSKNVLNKIMPIAEDSISLPVSDPSQKYAWQMNQGNLNINDQANGMNATGSMPPQGGYQVAQGPAYNSMSDNSTVSSGKSNNEDGTNLTIKPGGFNSIAHPAFDTANMNNAMLAGIAGFLPDTVRKNNLQPLTMGEQRDPYGVKGSGATFADGGSLSVSDRDAWERMQGSAYQNSYLGDDHSKLPGISFISSNGLDPSKLQSYQADMLKLQSSNPIKGISQATSGVNGFSGIDGHYGDKTAQQRYTHYMTNDNGKTTDYGTNFDAFRSTSDSMSTGQNSGWEGFGDPKSDINYKEPTSITNAQVVKPLGLQSNGFPTREEAMAKAKSQPQQANWHTDEDTDYNVGKSGIHIKPSHKGRFTAYKKRTGQTTEQALHSKNPHVRQMANFARNAKKWHHGEDGMDMEYYDKDYEEAADGVQMLGPGQMKPMSDAPNPMYEFQGPSHDDGGIPLTYGDQGAEVQGGETAHISPIDGSLHVDGAMKMPNLGSATKGLAGRSFQSIGKEIGKNENKATNMSKKADEIASNSNIRNKFDAFALGSSQALADASNQNMRAIQIQKEHIATIQDNMRNLAEYKDIDPKKAHTLFKNGGVIKADPGASVPYNYDKHGGRDFDMEKAKKLGYNGPADTKQYQKFLSDSYPTQVQAQGVGTKSKSWQDGIWGKRTDAITDAALNTQPQGLMTTRRIDPLPESGPKMMPTNIKATQAQTPIPMPANSGAPHNVQKSLSDYNRLGISDLAPAIKYLFETPESVPTGQITPNLKVPYQVSFQDRMNNNQSTFNAIAKQVGSGASPAALGSLAAQKYDADNQVAGEEFRANQGIANSVSNDNTTIMNEAQRANTMLNMDQLQKESMAKTNTEAHKAQALSWISDSVSQNAYENMNLRMLEMRSGYVYDPGANSGKGGMVYQGPNAYLAGTPGGTTGKSGDITSEYDADGNLTKTIKKQTAAINGAKMKASAKWGGMFK